MEQFRRIKQKAEEIRLMAEQFESNGISDIEKDIVLAELRDIYKEILLLNTKNDENNTQINSILDKDPKPVENKISSENQIDDYNAKDLNMVADNKISFEAETKPDYDVKAVEIVNKEQKVKTEVKIEETPKVTNHNNATNNGQHAKVIGDQLGKNKTSLNEKYSRTGNDISSRINLSPLSDIKSGIGVGDRFLYIKELFQSDNNLYDSSINTLNQLGSMDEALNYIDSTFDWDPESPTVQTFLNLVKRRYL
jgi:hypothetical protein